MEIFGPFGYGFSGFGFGSVLFSLSFLIFLGVFLFILVKGISQWNKNNHSPRLTVDATVVTKRSKTSHSHHGTGNHHHSSTWYYVTFQVESGDRMELSVSGSEFGMLVEGDRGKLSFQGTRYLGFERSF